MEEIIDCKLCKSEKCFEYSKGIINGKHSVKEVATIFNISEDEVYEHLYNHQWEEIIIETDEKSTYDCVKELRRCLDILNDWLMATIDRGSEDINNMRTGIALIKEVRSTIETLGKFSGELNEELVFKIDDMEGKFFKLTNELVKAKVCPECKIKLIEIIEEI
jgi:hypothetical protein